MIRKVSILLLLLTLLLAGCKSASQNGTAATGSSGTSQATAGPTTAPNQPSTLQVPGQAATVPGCTVVSFLPTPDPTSLFPDVSSDDWTNGPLTASVKIIEYSDFQ